MVWRLWRTGFSLSDRLWFGEKIADSGRELFVGELSITDAGRGLRRDMTRRPEENKLE